MSGQKVKKQKELEEGEENDVIILIFKSVSENK